MSSDSEEIEIVNDEWILEIKLNQNLDCRIKSTEVSITIKETKKMSIYKWAQWGVGWRVNPYKVSATG